MRSRKLDSGDKIFFKYFTKRSLSSHINFNTVQKLFFSIQHKQAVRVLTAAILLEHVSLKTTDLTLRM